MRAKTKFEGNIDPAAIAQETKRLESTEKKVKSAIAELDLKKSIVKTLEEAEKLKEEAADLVAKAHAKSGLIISAAKESSEKELTKVSDARKRFNKASNKLKQDQEQITADRKALSDTQKEVDDKGGELEGLIKTHKELNRKLNESIHIISEALSRVKV